MQKGKQHFINDKRLAAHTGHILGHTDSNLNELADDVESARGDVVIPGSTWLTTCTRVRAQIACKLLINFFHYIISFQ